MKKRNVLLKSLVALTLLSAMIVSALLGTSNAEYFKTLKKKLDMEIIPDRNLEYYLYDADDRLGGIYSPETGVYKNAESFDQFIIPGSGDGKNGALNDKVTIGGTEYNSGKNVVYQVKIPVDETGYYTLDFLTYMTLGTPDQLAEYNSRVFYTLNPTLCVGCEVLTDSDGVAFATNTPLNMLGRTYSDDGGANGWNSNEKEPLLYSDSSILGEEKDTINDSVYQWKTLCPYRTENVKLTFKVEEADVENGYVIWAWDFTGLQGGLNHTLRVQELTVNKTMNLDGTTDTRTSNDPYFVFPQTAYVNNVQDTSPTTAGREKYSSGRGTYVYEATENSLGMRAEMLFRKESSTANDVTTYYKDNPLSLYIPLKNVKRGSTYKVTFDFSVARQGTAAVDAAVKNGLLNVNASPIDYHSYDLTLDKIFENSDYADMCQSYLVSGVTTADNISEVVKTTQRGHTDAMDSVQYSDKTYTTYQLPNESTVRGYPLTKYDEFVKIKVASGSTYGPQNAYVDSVNDTYAVNPVTQNDPESRDQSTSRNWFNGVYHTEYNGQYKINWVTFYNTTFSFNIPSVDENGNPMNADVNLDDLYWVWAIDFLRYTAYYNIRIDNVRIQEVVEYSSSLDKNGVEIGGTPFSYDTHVTNKDADDDLGNVFISFRGRNGTGQNYQAKGYVLDKYTSTNNTQVFTNEGNIYAPIIDASKFVLTGDNAYKIRLDGSAVCQGGIEKYVFSIDGGKTWEDMTFEGTNASSDQLTLAEKGVNQYVSGQTRYDEAKFQEYGYDISDYTHVEFTEADALNGNFGDWKLIADLSEYKHQANLDVIIAAVPAVNTNFRCEILRIINFNPIRNYRTYTNNFVSDIDVTYKDVVNNETQSNDRNNDVSRLNVHYNGGEESENRAYSVHEDTNTKIYFNQLRGWQIKSNSPGSAGGGYARHVSYSRDYEDIRTIFTDFWVKTKLSITGWAIVEGGVDKYVWSADLGKTWYDCTGTPENSMPADQREWWYDGVNAVDDTLKQKASFEGSKDGTFNATNILTANLSKYEGEVVDVIFCAKPNNSDVYVPVGRIDNVGVYGENGIFYTRLVDTKEGTNTSNKTVTYKAGVILDHNASYRQFISPSDENVTIDSDFEKKWYLATPNSTQGFSYSVFEPYNVKASNARLYTDQIYTMQSGGKVSINGYVVCKGGVEQYKFSLDGGKTWTKINDMGDPGNIGVASELTSNVKYANIYSAASFVHPTDFANGCFLTDRLNHNTSQEPDANNITRGSDYMLSFNLPALAAGEVRNLLVVAETVHGKDVPVLHIKLKFRYFEDFPAQYGYYRSVKRGDVSMLDSGWIGKETNNEIWGFTPVPPKVANASNTAFNRITIPVTEAGKQQITFTHYLDNGPVTVSKTKHQIYNNHNAIATGQYTDVSLTVDKTHFVEGENIGFNFTCSYNKDTVNNQAGYGTVTIALVSDDFMDKKQYTLYSQKFAPNPKGTDKKTIRVDNIKVSDDPYDPDHGPNGVYSNGGMASWALDLKPGTYSIVVVHRTPSYKNSEGKTVYYSLADMLYNEDLRKEFFLVRQTIYIHDKDEKVDFSVIHDEGEYTYFSDVGRQFTAADSATNENIDHIYTLTDPFTNTDARGITAEINVTEADVKRGYVILETDYRGLMSQSDHTAAECSGASQTNDTVPVKHTDETCVSRNSSVDLPKRYYGETLYNFEDLADIKHPGVKYNVRIFMGERPLTKIPETSTALSIPFTSATSGYGTTALKVPVTEAGTYDLSFGGYLGSAVMHKGYDHGTTDWRDPNGSIHNNLTIDYSGAYMSLPKSVYVKGENIPVSYYTKGSLAASSPVKESGNLPYIGILSHDTTSDSADFENLDKDVNNPYGVSNKRNYVAANTAGVKYIPTANLDPGTYKIYLRDNSANLFHSEAGQTVYWSQYDMVTPICITIINPSQNKLDVSQECNFTNVSVGGNQVSGSITIKETVIFQGDVIDTEVNDELKGTGEVLWLGLYPKDGNGYVAWTYPCSGDSNNSQDIRTSEITNSGTSPGHPKDPGDYTLPAGKYTLYLLSGAGNLATAQKEGRVYAAIDIVILPKSVEKIKGNIDMHTLGKENGAIVDKSQRTDPVTFLDPEPFVYFNSGNMTVTVTEDDVARGYAFFEYDFTGLAPNTEFTFTVDRLTMTKRS